MGKRIRFKTEEQRSDFINEYMDLFIPYKDTSEMIIEMIRKHDNKHLNQLRMGYMADSDRLDCKRYDPRHGICYNGFDFELLIHVLPKDWEIICQSLNLKKVREKSGYFYWTFS